MPRYFLHVRNGFGFAPDEEGQELPGIREARTVAIAGARSLLMAEVATGRLDLRGRVEIADESGGLIETVEFRDAVAIESGELPEGPDGEP